MEQLTPQEHFCRLLVLDDKTPVEAYYDAFKYEGPPAKAKMAAASLLAVPEIQQRIDELRPSFLVAEQEGLDRLTLGEHLQELARLENMAVAAGHFGAAIQAAIHRGKASGLYVEKVVTAHVTLEELIAGSRSDGRVEVKDANGKTKVYGSGQPGKGLARIASATDAGKR